jgi:hypothetical protein
MKSARSFFEKVIGKYLEMLRVFLTRVLVVVVVVPVA